MALPPGLLYLLPIIPQLLVPPMAVCLLAYIARVCFGYNIPVWAIAAACVLSWPAALTVLVQWYDHKVDREAAARGSKMPRAVKRKYLGGVDALMAFDKAVEERIIGCRLSEWAQEYGWTFNFRLLFQNTIFTAEPEYIKRILATDFQGYEKGSAWYNQMKSLLGSGVFNVDGDLWN
ncbi:uncharacterized protein PHACADRAFT_189528 [Phanerochaete carnosa HHB-10118-sp]|uniref:Uncharacterized protein n=1 Tax=Phanerochaete carnosa (strain HHB-10118-sp) TaxID=650164 RepID=K5XBQ7_PHACS|nr:uncharacterized protein PHACADRAFT_189528 [Phanerochaete carnosa HHB-10118-sp]EKM60397.1 hypothetical protein PHACADRAFT_189528 [Phanerochaete carnosa HHB-10118-sp]